MGTTLKYEGFKVGQRIKAMDFEPCPGRMDRYVIGTIKKVGMVTTPHDRYMAYTIVVDFDTREIFRTRFIRVGQLVYVPVESTDDFENRVTLVPEGHP